MISIPIILILLSSILGYIDDNSQTIVNHTKDKVIIILHKEGRNDLIVDYKCSIFENGKVIYEGIDFQDNHHISYGSISKSKMKNLLLEFKRIDYPTIKDPCEGCQVITSCSPTVYTTFIINGKTWNKKHYLGCCNKAEQLTKLEEDIEKAVNVKQWLITLHTSIKNNLND